MDLVLGSTSKYRRQLLERLGVPFRCRAPLMDEEELKDPRLFPRELAESLAKAKALSLRKEEPHATIIGSDQLAACDGKILGKPGSVPAAVEQLQTLAGRAHQLITAVCVWHQGRTFRHVDIATLTMRPLTKDEIQRYVETDLPIDCAGSYKLEERGIVLFSSIQSADQSGIIGLPLIALTGILREIGYAIP